MHNQRDNWSNRQAMGPTLKATRTVLIALVVLGGAMASSAIATATTSTTTTTTAKKKVAGAHKPAPRPQIPASQAQKKKSQASPSTVVIGTPTASKRALAVPPAKPIAASGRMTALGREQVPGTAHGFGSTVVHVAQNDLHLELKP
jgi:hypothetical protein